MPSVIEGANRGTPWRWIALCRVDSLTPPENRLLEIDPEHLLYAAPPSRPGSTRALRLTPLQLLEDEVRPRNQVV